MPPQFVVEGFPTILRDKHQYLRNDARMPHCLRWGGMASLLGGLGDRFPQHNRDLPSKAPPLAAGIFTVQPDIIIIPSNHTEDSKGHDIPLRSEEHTSELQSR